MIRIAEVKDSVGDRYRSYRELTGHERQGEDYEIKAVARNRDPRTVVIAPHGGKIEPGTSEIAESIAGDAFVLYSFQGRKKSNNRHLHITSHRFDEPQAVALVEAAHVALAVHGEYNDGEEFVMVGGLHQGLVSAVNSSLERIGITTREPSGGLYATHPQNICNRTQRGGVQLEISRQLRDVLMADEQRRAQFADEMRNLLHQEIQQAALGVRT